MNKKNILKKLRKIVEEKYKNDKTGHDYAHILRVTSTALEISKEENADNLIVECASLMHEFADWKFETDQEDALENAAKILEDLEVDDDSIDQIIHILKYSSFKNTLEKDKLDSLEGYIVRDADMLDSIGAIGIARTFYFGGAYGMKMHETDREYKTNPSEEEYKKGTTCIGYFYEKLLKVKDLIKTQKGQEIAEERHRFLEKFLEEFLSEWEVDI